MGGGAREKLEHAEQVQHAGGHNKQIALLIAVLAAFLAISETLSKSAQTAAISHNVEAANLWAFFQAKTVRMTTVRTAAEAMTLDVQVTSDAMVRAAFDKQIDAWKKVADRYNDEPETGEGRKQLTVRATEAQHKRDLAMAQYHHFEIASAAFQVAIVLASAAVITGAIALAFAAGGLGVVGLILMGIGVFVPEAVHFV
jgi:hypothetical protein